MTTPTLPNLPLVWLVLPAVLAATSLVGTASAANWTLALRLDDQHVEGRPLAWSANEVLLLGRDGRLWRFHPGAAADYRELSPHFRSLSRTELGSRLQREFGAGFEVSGSGQFLVVHPAGQRDRWAPRFEELYRSFVHYFTARGIPLERPEFPMVAIVFADQADFLRYAARQGDRVDSNTLGYYCTTTNRIAMYDVTARGGAARRDLWHVNAATIIHEAAHQSAFNTGLHSRVVPPPRWLVEGVGTMFEMPGVWDSRRHGTLEDRVHPDQLAAFLRYAETRRPSGSLAELVASDQPFRVDPAGAYAESWALTFYLAERRTAQFARYLRRTAKRSALADYSAPQRVADFTEIFGRDLVMLESRMLRYLNELADLPCPSGTCRQR